MSIRKSIAWSFSEQTLQYGLQFVSAIVIARLLTPDEMGIFALAMSASVVMTTLRNFGVGSYLIREPDLNLSKIRSAFGVMLTISWSLGLLLFLGRHALAELYGRAGIAEVIVVLAVSFFISPFGAPISSLLAREMRFKVLHNIGLSAAFAGTVLSISLAYSGFSYMSLAWGLLLTTVLNTLLPLFVMPQYAFLLPSFAHWRGITKFGGLLSVCSLLGTVNSEGVKFLLGAFLNPAAVAQFERAVQVPNIFRRAIFLPIGRVMLPVFSERVREGRPVGHIVEKLVAGSVVLTWPTFLVLAMVAEPLIVTVFGENWRPAGRILPEILLAQALLVLLPQPEQILVPRGLIGRLFLVRAIGAVVSLSSAFVAVQYGLEAFAAARVLAAVSLVTLVALSCYPYLGVTFAALMRLYLQAIVVSVIAAIPASLYLLAEIPIGLEEILIIILTSAVAWVLGVFVTRHMFVTELRNVRARLGV